jgi:tetratricopeptide (TPR) repeat protein
VRIPIRKAFAILLFILALVPVGLVAGFFLGDPTAVFRFAESGAVWLTYGAWGGAGIFVVGLLIYPPFLPFLRMRWKAIMSRLGTDRGPMLEGIAQLRNFETHANRLLVGRMARQLGDAPVAMENLARAFELEPDHVGGRYQFGLLLTELGRSADAANLFASVVVEDETHAFGDALFHLGKMLFRLHRDAEALTALRRHQTLFPGGRQVHLLVARVLADQGELESAKAELKLAARPAEPGEHLVPEENLARARAKVTFLWRRKGE